MNLVISNVPGLRSPLYTAGAALAALLPRVDDRRRPGLNITVQSYLNTLDFGLVSCRELVPDLWDLLDDILTTWSPGRWPAPTSSFPLSDHHG